jgi:hypothetical protein
MIEFVQDGTTPRLVRRFIYQPITIVDDGSDLQISPSENQPKFRTPPFRNEMFEDLAAQAQEKPKRGDMYVS